MVQYLHELLPGRRVLCTQPRRVAAATLAERVAEEGALVARALEVAHLDDRVRAPEEVGRREERDAEEAVDGGHHDAERLGRDGSHC